MALDKKYSSFSIRPSEFADELGILYSNSVTPEHKKNNGQFFTPIEISEFMSSIASQPKSKSINILDPGCGTAILSISLIEELIKYEIVNEINLTLYETDCFVLSYTEQALQYLKEWLAHRNIRLNYTLVISDFIKDMAEALEIHKESFDYIISNPPYFKLSKDDERTKLLTHLVKGQPNIYSFFIAVSINLLKSNGELIFIVPRSFASGLYFNSFRNYFFNNINLCFVHLFNSRSKTFKRDKVLQETLIFKAVKQKNKEIVISTSEGIKDLKNSQRRVFETIDLVDLKSSAKILHLPTSDNDIKVLKLFRTWKNNLIDFGIQVSTGPVVSFRSKEFLYKQYLNSTVHLTELFWLHNIDKMKITWPILNINKAQYIKITDESKKILIPNKNYVFLRRFSSKDDKSRLISAPYRKENSQNDFIGVENKLNYIYKIENELSNIEAVGISALLNSKVFDTYFRTFNGNVNVSATEIRLMPFPPIEQIRELGEFIISENNFEQDNIDTAVALLIENKLELVNG